MHTNLRLRWVWLFCVAALIAAWWPLLTGARTVSFDVTVADLGRPLVARVLPVADPAAGSFQDGPWLSYLQRTLRQGRLPLVNTYNGLGASFLETLQPAVLYPANLLLPLLPRGVRAFDYFQFIHAIILVSGLLLLLRLYARVEVAALLALAATLSPLSFNIMNMVHFRVLAWTPWMVYGAVRMARQPQVTAALALSASVVFSLSAGNPQESVTGLVLTGCVFASEWLRHSGNFWRRGLAGAGTMAAALLMSMPAVLPYFAALRHGEVFSVGASDGPSARSVTPVAWQWMLDWWVPRINGYADPLVRSRDLNPPLVDLQAGLAPLLVVGLGLSVYLLWRGKLPRAAKVPVIVYLAFFALGWLKVMHLPMFEFVGKIPVLGGLRFTKYHSYLHILAAMIAAWALETACRRGLHRVVAVACAVYGAAALVLLVGLGVFDPTWRIDPAWASTAYWATLGGWAVTLLAAALLAACFRTPSPGAWRRAMLVVAVAGILTRPPGFPARRASDIVEAQGGEGLPPHRLADWLDMRRQSRIVSRVHANANLWRASEELGVFDPVVNAAYRNFMVQHLPLENPYFAYQPPAGMQLTHAQVDALKFLGTHLIEGFRVPDDGRPDVVSYSPWHHALQGALPRAFTVPEAVAQAAEQACAAQRIDEALAVLKQPGALEAVSMVRRGANSYRLDLVPEAGRRLVVTQAFNSGWSLAGAPAATPWCGLYLSWPTYAAGSQRLSFWPVGLTAALRVASMGVVVLALVLWISPAQRRSLWRRTRVA